MLKHILQNGENAQLKVFIHFSIVKNKTYFQLKSFMGFFFL